MRRLLSVSLSTVLVAGIGIGQAAAQVQVQGDLTSFTPTAGGAAPDFVNAKPMLLPQSAFTDDMRLATLASPPAGVPQVVPGFAGSGAPLNSVFLGKPAAVGADSGVAPQEFGSSEHPFSTATADIKGAVGLPSSTSRFATNTMWPYRPSGKLFFTIPAGIPGQIPGSYVCSASLIRRGIVVTAAHCVNAYGQSAFYTNWNFVPGYRNGSAPYGSWSAAGVWVLTKYFTGLPASQCAVAGVVCDTDIAIIELNSQGGNWPGSSTGWYGYGYDGYGFNASNIVQITQTGYPVCLESGAFMQRNDSYGFTGSLASFSSNTIIGSLMCGGSSGGPWLTTFGVRPGLTGTTTGSEASTNIVVGVTSWGYFSTAVKEQGATRFRASNLIPLINAACGSPFSDPKCL